MHVEDCGKCWGLGKLSERTNEVWMRTVAVRYCRGDGNESVEFEGARKFELKIWSEVVF